MTYDLYSKPSNTLIKADVTSGYVYTFIGIKDFFVKAINPQGSTDSNDDQGIGLISIKNPITPIVSIPSKIMDFSATDIIPGEIILTWSDSSAIPLPTYDLYKDGALLATNIDSGYDHAFEGTANFYVIATNSAGSTSSNDDLGTGIIIHMFSMEVTSSVKPEVIATGGTVTIDNNNDGTYHIWSMDPITHIKFNLHKEHITEVVVNTGDTLTSAEEMFMNCTGLISVDILKLTEVEGALKMFLNCTSLTTIDVSGLSKATALNEFFENCKSLTSVDVSGMVSATNNSAMFHGCTNLKTAHGIMEVTRNSPYYYNMFCRCTNLICIDGIDTRVTVGSNRDDLFKDCNSLINPNAAAQAIIVGSTGDEWYNPNLCGEFKPKRIVDFKATDNLIGKITMTWSPSVGYPTPTYNLYRNNSRVATNISSGYEYTYNGTADFQVVATNTLGFAGSNVDSGTSVPILFRMTVTSTRAPGFRWYNSAPNASHVLHVDNMNNGTYNVWSTDPIQTIGFDANKEYITKVVVITGDTVTGNFHMSACKALVDVDVSKLVNLTSASNMFNGTKLIHVDISSLSKLTTTVGMLNNCHSLLTAVGVEAATRNSTNSRAMFAGSEKLRCIDGIDTRKGVVTGGTSGNAAIFLGCNALVQPNAGSRAALERIPGTSWHNPSSCGTYTPPKNFEIKVTSHIQPGVKDVVGGTITVNNNNDGTWFLWSNSNITSFKMDTNKEHITKIEILEVDKVTNLNNTFDGCKAMTSFSGGSKFINVTNTNYTWRGCISLTSFDASWMTKVATITHAWYGCTGLTDFDTNGLTLAWNIFMSWRNCTGLTSFNARGLISASSGEYAWYNCKALTSFDVSPLITLKNALCTWQGCKGLTSFDASPLTAVAAATNAWKGCSGLTSFDASGLTAVTNATSAWNGCSNIVCFNELDSTGFTTKTDMLKDCTSLIAPDAAEQVLLESTTGSVYTNPNLCPDPNQPPPVLPRKRFEMLVTSPKVPNYEFGGITVDITNNKDGTYLYSTDNIVTELESILKLETAVDMLSAQDLVSVRRAWYQCSNLVSFNASELSSVQDAGYAWAWCLKLMTFDVSGLTSAQDIDYAWSNCTSLTTFNTTGLDKAIDISKAWYGCTGLTDFDTSGLASNVDAHQAWQGCSSLTCFNKLDSTAFTNKTDMLKDCTSLIAPDAVDQGFLESLAGYTYVNPNPCPSPILTPVVYNAFVIGGSNHVSIYIGQDGQTENTSNAGVDLLDGNTYNILVKYQNGLTDGHIDLGIGLPYYVSTDFQGNTEQMYNIASGTISGQNLIDWVNNGTIITVKYVNSLNKLIVAY